MNIQLFFENQEVELNDKVSFPLNKSFENLWNPTDIIIEYSKSIKIPATAANNRLMANAYRIDRQFIINEQNPNIGMFLDPLKRIPMKLVYNGTILLDGYAKYTSATINSKETYYTFNLYGALGDIFQKLLDCVVDENKLTDEQKAESDGGAKYVIACPWERYIINKDFVKASWDRPDPSLDASIVPYDYIGMAPAYRGLYSDFESNSVYALNGAFPSDTANGTSVEEQLKYQWKVNLKGGKGYTEEQAQARVDSLDFNMILPNGLNEHNMRQFRSYEQKPYIYIHGLMKLFRRKCEDLTGYTINLDHNWFNVNNPYWSKLCYMLDYLSVKGGTTDSSLPFTGYSERYFTNQYCQSAATYTITDPAVLSKGDINVDSFTLGLRVKDDVPSTAVNPSSVEIKMRHRSYVTLDVEITSNGTTAHKYFWGGTGTPNFGTAGTGPSPSDKSKYPESTYIYMTEQTEYDSKNRQWVYTGYLTIPAFTIPHSAGSNVTVKYNVQFGRDYVSGDYLGWYYTYTSNDGKDYITKIPSLDDWSPIANKEWEIVPNNPDFMFIFPNITYSTNWRNSTTCELKNLYTKDEPLFDVILQYTKMFGLIWKPDYQKKTIDIMTRATYFKNYNVVDWSNKVDRSKGLTIEPVSFASKYVTFNYEDVDGYRYSGYRNKYGVDYGEKKLKTKYNFDTNEEKLFKQKIYPSSMSCKSYPTVNDLRSWDTITKLPVTESEINFIDCENTDQTAAISMNNWYFRDANFDASNTYYISDLSTREISEGKCYWYSNMTLPADFKMTTNVLPQFSTVIKSNVMNTSFGCLFYCPNDDYTKDFRVASANGNFIYDICWEDYINERYNANNKKVTCYVKLSPIEFEQFNFRTFVTIDNQLFVVNKIFDFDVTTPTTKVELIQVTNIEGYIGQRVTFPAVVYEVDEIYMNPEADNYGAYSFYNFKVICHPSLNELADISAVPISVGSPNSHIIEIEPEYYGNYETNVYLGYESDGVYTEEWELHIDFNDGTKKVIPIHINAN